MQTKDVLRKKYRSEMKSFYLDEFVLQEIVSRLKALLKEPVPRVVVGYSAIKGEVDLSGLYDELEAQNIVLAFPRYNSVTEDYEVVAVNSWREQLICARYNIAEPLLELPAMGDIKSGDSAVWLIPGIAFSPNGVRLGRGKGYYDRLLVGCKGLKLGIVPSNRIEPLIPWESHDILMDRIVTEKEIIDCREGGKWSSK